MRFALRSLSLFWDSNRIPPWNQGGHALVALYTEGAMPLHKVTCVPRGHALGYVRVLVDRMSW
jgi:ATP-dependent metalloprotease